jgi:hypothetical protein
MAIRVYPVLTPVGTANRVAVFDAASGVLEASTVTITELAHLSGISGNVLTDTNSATVSNKTFGQVLLPDANGTRDIGSSGTRWKDAYLSGQLNSATINTTGDVTVGGNLTVNGTTTTLNTANLNVTDKNITVNNGGSDASSEGAGLTVARTGTSGSLIYAAASATKFRLGALGSEVDVVGTSSTQTLTNKTLVVASNTITTAASGNLTATELNAALAQLQTNIDGKQASSANLSALSGLSSSTGFLVETAAATFTQRTLTAGSSAISISNGSGVSGNPSIDVSPGNITHSTLGGLTTGDAGHTQFVVLAGRSGGQTIDGDTASAGNLTLSSTAHATKGKIFLGPLTVDEANNRVGVNATSPSTAAIDARPSSDATGGSVVFTSADGSKSLSMGTANNGVFRIVNQMSGSHTLLAITGSQDALTWGQAAKAAFMAIKPGSATPTASPTMTLEQASSQSGAALEIWDNAGTPVKQASITHAGALTAVSLKASGLSTGVAHVDSTGLLSSSAVVLTSEVSGILPSANGGTGVNNAGTLTYGSNNITLTTSGATSLTLPTSGTAATLAGTQALTNKDYQGGTASDTSRLTVPSAAKATLDGLTRKAATLVYGTDTLKLYADNGTSLVAVGSGSGSGINLATLDTSFASTKSDNFDAESSVGDWVAYADAAGTAPVDMTGGSPNTTIARNTSSPMDGSADFKITITTGASRQGEGASLLVNVPPAYRGRNLEIKFPFATSGTLIEDDLVLYCYDVTNSSLIKPYTKSKILGASGIAQAVFPVSSNTTQVRVGVHIARTSTGALTVNFDDFQVSPFTMPVGVAGSDWTSYVPTFTGFGTPSNVSFWWRRVGDSVHIIGQFTSGSTTATEARISLPNSVTSDSTKIPSHVVQKTGTWYRDNGGASATTIGGLTLIEGNVGYFTFGGAVYTQASGSVNPYTKINGNTSVNSTDNIEVDAIIPISGWSSNVSMAESSTFWISSLLANGSRVTGSAPTALGQYRSYLRNASNRTYTETNGSPTTSPTAADGIKLYGSATWASNDTNNHPSRYDIFIGKNKVYRVVGFSSTGKSGNLCLDPIASYGGADCVGCLTSYDPTTGVLSVTNIAGNASQCQIGVDSAGGEVQDGYFDIQVSENALCVTGDFPRSEVYVQTANGYGATNTKIRRFTTVQTNIGTAITYADSSNNGASFTINETGLFGISYSDQFNTGGALGISKNSSQLTTGITSITASDRMGVISTSGSGFGQCLSFQINLAAGDVIRAHTNADASGANTVYEWFRITKINS